MIDEKGLARATVSDPESVTSSQDIPKMNLLFVHGNGSNSNVIQSQAASFQQELRRIIGDGTKINSTYVQGRMEAPPYPGIGELFAPPFYNIWDADSPPSVLATIDLIASAIGTYDPNVVVAHSDGGAAALSALLHRPHNIKCLVLLSSFPPFDAAGRRRLDVSLAGKPLVRIPTIFVRGESDPWAHFVTLTEGLVEESRLTLFPRSGGHEVPNSSERAMWARMAHKLVDILRET